jgi:hypothetical protein
MGSKFAEMPGSPKEKWTEDGIQATGEYMCLWDDRWDVVKLLLAGGPAYPHDPTGFCRARTGNCEPMTGELLGDPFLGDGYADYEFAKITIDYNTKGASKDLYEEEFSPTCEFMTLDATDFRWDNPTGDVLTDKEAPGKLVRSSEYKVVLHEVAEIPSELDDLEGCCNSDKIWCAARKKMFLPETLLYTPPTMSRKITTEMTEAWTMTFKFMYRQSGWNKFWRKNKLNADGKQGDWATIWLKDGAMYQNYLPKPFLPVFCGRNKGEKA